jgi:hypothetical protein
VTPRSKYRPLVILIVVGSLFAAFFGGPLLRQAGLSILVTDGIQLLCAALALALVVREFRTQLASERANVLQSRIAKVLVLVGSAGALVVYLLLVIGKNH